MFKSPSRNQRSKGLKIKHVLQIFLLLGVCFWLIYQVKHSHDKKKEFDEKDGIVSLKTQSDQVIVKFGRKDLPQVQQVPKNFKHEEEEEEEEETGVEENRHEEEKDKNLEEKQGTIQHEEEQEEEAINHEEQEQEEANKHEGEEQEEVHEDEDSKHDDEGQEGEIKDEEIEEEGRGVGDDEVDENEQLTDGEAVREELVDEEKEREAEGDDRENEEKEAEEKEGQDEGDQNQDIGGGRNAHEAREEHYKADDASSAVSHDSQLTNTEADSLDVENSNDNSTMNNLEQESKANATEETNGDENKSGVNVNEGKQSEGGSSLTNSEYISLPHATDKTDFINQSSNNSRELINETDNKPAEVNIESPGSRQNGAATDLKSTSAQNTTEDGLASEEKHKEQANETISNSEQAGSDGLSPSKTEIVDSSTRESLNSSPNTESGMPEDITKIHATAGMNSSTSSITLEITDSSQNEESGGKDESSDTSSSNSAVDESQHDLIDSSENTLPQEERDARVDLSTLPDITTQGINNEDAAAE